MSNARTDRRTAASATAAAAAVLVAAALLTGPAPPARAAPSAEDPVFFRKPDAETAAEILRFIGLFGSPAPSDRERARDGLFDIGYWTVPRLLESLRSDNAAERSSAILVLGRLNDPVHGKLRDGRILQPLRDTVGADARSEWPPALAALMLGRIRDKDPRALDMFRAALAAREGEKRRVAVALALGRLAAEQEKAAGDMLESMLAGRLPTPDARNAALLALGFFPRRVAEVDPVGTEEIPAGIFRRALQDRTEGVRRSAVLALLLSRRDSFHDVFMDRFRNDGDGNVRAAALLAVGARRDAETTALLARTLESTRPTAEERTMAAYLLFRRADPAGADALLRTVLSPGSPDLQAAALLALAPLEDGRVRHLVLQKLGDRSATLRSAAAVATTRFVSPDALEEARATLRGRLLAGESDGAVRENFRLAEAEVEARLEEFRVRAAGKEPPPRPAPEWKEIDGGDLAGRFLRDERQTALDLANEWAETCLGIAGLLAYRTHFDNPASSDPDAPGRPRRAHLRWSEQYDLALELTKRPYYDLDDLPRFVVPVQPGGPR